MRCCNYSLRDSWFALNLLCKIKIIYFIPRKSINIYYWLMVQANQSHVISLPCNALVFLFFKVFTSDVLPPRPAFLYFPKCLGPRGPLKWRIVPDLTAVVICTYRSPYEGHSRNLTLKVATSTLSTYDWFSSPLPSAHPCSWKFCIRKRYSAISRICKSFRKHCGEKIVMLSNLIQLGWKEFKVVQSSPVTISAAIN